MSAAPELAGVRSKFSWAKEHFDSINSAIERMRRPKKDTHKPPPYEYHPDRQELIIKTPKRTPLDPSLPLLVGDCIHNLRSALDHLVFQLALRRQPIAPEWAEKIAFPIYLAPKSFSNFVERRVTPFVSGDAVAEIEKMQPYSAVGGGATSILWVLSQLDIIDKHRLLVVAVAKFRPVAFQITLSTGQIFSHDIDTSEWKPLEEGTEIIRFDLSKAITQPGKMKVNVKTANSVQLEKTGLACDGMELQRVIADCIDEVNFIVRHFGRKFFAE